MKLFSWNVNGLRAVLNKNALQDFLAQEKPDVLVLQEIKISEKTRLDLAISIPGYQEFWHSAKRPGYSGTLALVREGIKILDNFVGDFDDEGRLQVLEFDKFYLLNIYFPNAKAELERLDYKQEFNKKFLSLVKKLEKKKPVIATGDFNVAHQEIDLAHPKENEGHTGFTKEERGDFSKFIKHGLIDTFRYLNKDKVQYSWWSFRAAARARNVGWRIDYFLVSDKMKKQLKKAAILDDVMGSDHCPVMLEI